MTQFRDYTWLFFNLRPVDFSRGFSAFQAQSSLETQKNPNAPFCEAVSLCHCIQKGQVKAHFCESFFKIHASLGCMKQYKVCNPHCRGPTCCLCVNWSTYRQRSILVRPSLPPFVVSLSFALPPSLLHRWVFFFLGFSVALAGLTVNSGTEDEREWTDAVFNQKSDYVALICYLYPYWNQTDPFGLRCNRRKRSGGG